MKHYQREDDRRKIEYKQMISKIQTPSCVVMDETMKTNKENSKPDIVPPDIMEINTVNQTIITTSVLKTAPTMMASKTMRSNIPMNKQKTTTKTNTATSPWLRFLAQPCTKILPSQEYLKQCQMKTAKTNKRKLNNTDINRFHDCPS